MKKCCICKEEKELAEFNKNRAKKDGYQSRCRDCDRKHALKVYHKDIIHSRKTTIARNKKRIFLVSKLINEYKQNKDGKEVGIN